MRTLTRKQYRHIKRMRKRAARNLCYHYIRAMERSELGLVDTQWTPWPSGPGIRGCTHGQYTSCSSFMEWARRYGA